MKLTRERKIYAGLLAVAVAALLAEQVFFADAPASAQAQTGTFAAPPAVHPSAMPAAAPGFDSRQFDFKVTELNAANSLAHRLDAVAKQHHLTAEDVDNAFEPSVAWIAAPPPPVAPLPMRGKEFEAGHKLAAVVTYARGGLAMVDGKPLKVGQEIDGFVLVSVTPTSAVFKSGDVNAVLELKLPGGAELPPRHAP